MVGAKTPWVGTHLGMIGLHGFLACSIYIQIFANDSEKLNIEYSFEEETKLKDHHN
jgi:hypothetical protein